MKEFMPQYNRPVNIFCKKFRGLDTWYYDTAFYQNFDKIMSFLYDIK